MSELRNNFRIYNNNNLPILATFICKVLIYNIHTHLFICFYSFYLIKWSIGADPDKNSIKKEESARRTSDEYLGDVATAHLSDEVEDDGENGNEEGRANANVNTLVAHGTFEVFVPNLPREVHLRSG